MEQEPKTDGHVDPSTEEILESLLVDDAEIVWDPTTGKPHVSRRPLTDVEKSTLDRPPGTP